MLLCCSWKHFWNVCAFDKYCMLFTSSVIKVGKHHESIATGSRKSPTSRSLLFPPPSVRCCMKSNTPKVLKPKSAWGGVKCKLWPAFTEWFSFLFLFFKRFHPELCELSRMIRYNQVIDKSLKASAIYDDAQIAWEQMNLSCHVMIS